MSIKIYAWSDYFWFREDNIIDLDLFLSSNGLSDDFKIITLPSGYSEELITEYVHDSMDGKECKRRFGSKFQYEYPEKCPKDCSEKPDYFYQGCACSRCPVMCCSMPKNKEDEDYMPMIDPEGFRDDWAKIWDTFFKTGQRVELPLKKKEE